MGFNVQCLALGSAALPWVGVCAAADPGLPPSMQGREISFYISQPIGPGAAPRSFGFRIDQHAAPSATDLSGRHELVNLRMVAHENLRLDFGRHVSWDFSRRQFTTPGDLVSMKGGLADHAAAPARLALP